MSSECKDLIKKLLTVDAGQRLSAVEALKHKWFELFDDSYKPLEMPTAEIVKRLKHFQIGRAHV